MKFTSRKDTLFKSVVFGANAILIGIAISILLKGQIGFLKIGILLLLTGIVIFWLWTFLRTEYELTESDFIYRSGPIKKKIGINRIKEIVKDKTLWIGNWPTTAKKGLIIKYGNYSLINISPETNENFIAKILEINNDIKITE